MATPVPSDRDVRYTMECIRCGFHRTVRVSGTVRPGMTNEEQTVAIARQCVQAEDNFFRDHWLRGGDHSAEGVELQHHIDETIGRTSRYVRMKVYHEKVMRTRMEGNGIVKEITAEGMAGIGQDGDQPTGE